MPTADRPGQTHQDARVIEFVRPDIVPTGRLRLLAYPGRPTAPTVATLPLDVRTYENATAISLLGFAVPNQNIGAVYDHEGRLITETQRARPGPAWTPSPAQLPASGGEPIRLTGRTFFAGRHHAQFGHTLLETLTRFWPDLDYRSYDNFLTIPNHAARGQRGATSVVAKIMRTAGIHHERFAIAFDHPVVCDSIDVPTAPFHVTSGADPALLSTADPRFLNVFHRIGERVAGSTEPRPSLPARVYFSRSRLVRKKGAAQKRSSAANEALVETFLAQHGFETVHPQELPFERQVELVQHAEVIVGFDGSALHLAVFASPGTKLLALDTRKVPNQFLIDQAVGLDAVHVWAASERVANRAARWTVDMDRLAAGLDLLTGDSH